MKLKSFQVRQASHWVFEDIGLRDGDSFGAGKNIVGYETDAADNYLDALGNLRLTRRDGTPPLSWFSLQPISAPGGHAEERAMQPWEFSGAPAWCLPRAQPIG